MGGELLSMDLASELVAAAAKAREKAYAPYSKFPVGAALLTEEGEIFSGTNIENSSSGLTVCAERVAVFSAIMAGSYRFSAMAVIGDSAQPVFPCGSCRQVLWELAGDVEIIAANCKDEIITAPLSRLLPHPFSSVDFTTPRDYF